MLGQYLTGTITFAKDELGKKACSYLIRYILPEPTKNTNKNATSQAESGPKETPKDSPSNSSTTSVLSNGTNEANSNSPTSCKDKETKEKPKEKLEDYNEALVEFKISHLEKLGEINFALC